MHAYKDWCDGESKNFLTSHLNLNKALERGRMREGSLLAVVGEVKHLQRSAKVPPAGEVWALGWRRGWAPELCEDDSVRARLLVTQAGCRLSSSCSAIYGEDDAPCPSRVEVEFLGFGKADTPCNSGWWQRLSTPLQAGAQIIPMITGSSLFSSTVKILRPIYRISRHMYKVLNIN
jgi:hypothetical protein